LVPLGFVEYTECEHFYGSSIDPNTPAAKLMDSDQDTNKVSTCILLLTCTPKDIMRNAEITEFKFNLRLTRAMNGKPSNTERDIGFSSDSEHESSKMSETQNTVRKNAYFCK
jgi:hypothetical protein